MASGQVAARILAPEWRTVVGVVRSRISGSAGPPRTVAMGGGRTRHQTVLWAGGRPPAAEPRESWERLSVRRDGVFMVESSFSADGDPFIVRRRSADGTATLTVPGQGTRAAQNEFEWGHGVWMLEPGAFAPAWDLVIAEDPIEVLGREAVVVLGRARPVPNPWASGVRLLIGTDPGDRCEMVVDVATGICLRFTNLDDGSVTAAHEFTEIALDVDVDDAVGEWATEPGQRLRTHIDDFLDHLRARGVDVDGIDPNSETAMEEAHRRLAAADAETFGPLTRPSPTLHETVAPLGPPPANRDAAVAAITSALAGLGPDDPRPRAETIEYGHLLDEDDESAGGRPTHPMVVGPVRVELAEIVFLTPDLAFVEMRIDIGQGGGFTFPGRAVHRDGRWLVSYDTAARLRAMAGRPVPPLEAEGT